MLSKNVIVLPEFATSTCVFCEVIGTSAKAFKKMSSSEVVASSSLMFCRSKNAENQIIIDIHMVTTSNKC